MKNILIDTNFLVECAKNKIDIQAEITKVLHSSFIIVVLDRTMDELNVIAARGKKEGQAAKLAMTILMTKKVTVLPTEGGHTDKLLLEKADENHIVATMDKALKQKLKKKGQDVIIIRGKKRLAVVKA